jgi:putative FmdB family regulatory protein
VPTYAYTCTSCQHGLEVKQSFTDDALTTCPECSGRLRKVFNSVGVVFKGSGFYRTDSRKPEGGGSSDSGAAASKEPSTSSSGKESAGSSSSKESTGSSSATNGSSGSSGSSSTPSSTGTKSAASS